mmetsp:Transcript_21994/g.34168  ORF Transcript_21994/g.34168 Transcript_21994/m.34168 type:complete len:207 (+) Transcript_21994:166-786(+)
MAGTGRSRRRRPRGRTVSPADPVPGSPCPSCANSRQTAQSIPPPAYCCGRASSGRPCANGGGTSGGAAPPSATGPGTGSPVSTKYPMSTKSQQPLQRTGTRQQKFRSSRPLLLIRTKVKPFRTTAKVSMKAKNPTNPITIFQISKKRKVTLTGSTESPGLFPLLWGKVSGITRMKTLRQTPLPVHAPPWHRLLVEVGFPVYSRSPD